MDSSRTSSGTAWLAVAIAYAGLVSPWIGGIRGVPVYVGWVLVPLLFALRGGGWSALGLAPGRHLLGRHAGAGLLGLLVGGGAGMLLLATRGWGGIDLLGFLPLLPWLHRATVGDSLALFVAMIPVAHVCHELFYRGTLQNRLAERTGPVAAILVAGVLFAWTHVLVFTSADAVAGLAAIEPGADPALLVGATLRGVLLYALLESIVAGLLLLRTRSLAAPVLFRATTLTVVVASVLGG